MRSHSRHLESETSAYLVRCGGPRDGRRASSAQRRSSDRLAWCDGERESSRVACNRADVWSQPSHGRIPAEVGFLLIVVADVWRAAAQISPFRFASEGTVVAGAALALDGILLIIATYWGQFGQLP